MTEYIPEKLRPIDGRPASVIPVLNEGDAYPRARLFEDIQDATRGIPDPDKRAKIAARMIEGSLAMDAGE